MSDKTVRFDVVMLGVLCGIIGGFYWGRSTAPNLLDETGFAPLPNANSRYVRLIFMPPGNSGTPLFDARGQSTTTTPEDQVLTFTAPTCPNNIWLAADIWVNNPKPIRSSLGVCLVSDAEVKDWSSMTTWEDWKPWNDWKKALAK